MRNKQRRGEEKKIDAFLLYILHWRGWLKAHVLRLGPGGCVCVCILYFIPYVRLIIALQI